MSGMLGSGAERAEKYVSNSLYGGAGCYGYLAHERDGSECPWPGLGLKCAPGSKGYVDCTFRRLGRVAKPAADYPVVNTFIAEMLDHCAGLVVRWRIVAGVVGLLAFAAGLMLGRVL